jgi:hypothetical protein
MRDIVDFHGSMVRLFHKQLVGDDWRQKIVVFLEVVCIADLCHTRIFFVDVLPIYEGLV